MAIHVTPGVYFETLDTDRSRIRGLRTDIAGLVGIAERGPLHRPIRVSSQPQFAAVFGSFIAEGYLAYAVKAFFENGGRTCHVVRVAAATRETRTLPVLQPADRASSRVGDVSGFAAGAVVTLHQTLHAVTTGAVQPADRMSSLVLEVAGFTPRAWVQVAQAGAIAWRRVQAVDPVLKVLQWETALPASLNLAQPIQFGSDSRAEQRLASVAPGVLAWEEPLPALFALDLPSIIARPVTFTTGAGSANGVFLDNQREPVLACEAASPGAWGNALAVQLSRSHLHATRAQPGPQPSAHDWLTVEDTTGFEVGTLVRLFQDGSAGEVHRTVTAIDAVRSRFRWDAPLPATWYLDPITLSTALSLESQEFGLTVYERGLPRESFSNLSLEPSHAARLVETVINTNSALIRVRRLQPASNAADPGHWPDPTAEILEQGRLRLVGGRNGTAGLETEDFTGVEIEGDFRGLRTLEEVDEISLVAIPDIHIRPVPPITFQVPPRPLGDPCLPCGTPALPAEPPPPGPTEDPRAFSLDEIHAVQQALIRHGETLRDRLAVLDAPWFDSAVAAMDTALIQSWRARFETKYAALYYPWLLVVDPLQPSEGWVRPIPPSGHVLGLMARTDHEAGVHVAPANREFRWVQGATSLVSPELQGVLNPRGINCIRSFAGRGIRLYGARTLSSDPAWRYVNVRRLMMMIEEAVEESVQWAVFEPHSIELRVTLVHAISSFLQAQWERGALVGNTAEEAYFVRCDDTNNPPSEVDLGRLLAEVGVAPVRPAEFIVFRIGRTRDELEIDE